MKLKRNSLSAASELESSSSSNPRVSQPRAIANDISSGCLSGSARSTRSNPPAMTDLHGALAHAPTGAAYAPKGWTLDLRGIIEIGLIYWQFVPLRTNTSSATDHEN
jgi:hypothetical protein